MAKNLIPEIAKMLGVELGEEFKVAGDKDFEQKTFYLTARGLKVKLDQCPEKEIPAMAVLDSLLFGDTEIIKLPWKPQYDQPYWTFRWIANKNRLDVWQNVWFNSVEEVALLKAGWVFRTREEAQDAQPKVEEEFIAKYGLYKKRKLQHVAKISCKLP